MGALHVLCRFWLCLSGPYIGDGRFKKSPQMQGGPCVTKQWLIGLDADDTLWHNERVFQLTQTRFAAMLADHIDHPALMQRLLAAERRNLGIYGYGIKGFMLSMVETAIEATDGRVSTTVLGDLLALGRDMLAHPIDLLPGVQDCLTALAGRVDLVLITKGDLLDQERKLAQSGLGDYFTGVEIVSEKTPAVYQRIFARGNTRRSMMVGNSLKSDVIPALEAGGWGVHVPHDLTWELEHAEPPTGHPRYHSLQTLDELPGLLDFLDR